MVLLYFRSAVRAAGGFDRNGREALRAVFAGGLGRRGRSSRFLHVVCRLDDEEDDEGNDEKVHNGLDE